MTTIGVRYTRAQVSCDTVFYLQLYSVLHGVPKNVAIYAVGLSPKSLGPSLIYYIFYRTQCSTQVPSSDVPSRTTSLIGGEGSTVSLWSTLIKWRNEHSGTDNLFSMSSNDPVHSHLRRFALRHVRRNQHSRHGALLSPLRTLLRRL